MPNHAEFHVESLENRNMLAGDVSVSVSGGDLRIIGDTAGNELTVEGTNQPGEYRVVGGNGTTINGQDMGIFSFVTEGIYANLGAGNDKIGIKFVSLQEDLRVRTGGGDDTVFVLGGHIMDDVDIRTGSGDDAAGVEEVGVGDRVIIRTEAGRDEVLLRGVQAKSAEVNTGRDSDEALVQMNTIDNRLRVNLGAGNDLMYDRMNVGDVDVNGGTGVDNRFSGGVSARNFELNRVTSYSYIIGIYNGDVTLSVELRYWQYGTI